MPHPMRKVRMTATEVYPALDIVDDNGPESVEVPENFIQRIRWARLMHVKAEGALYDWMLRNDVMPEEVKEILAQHQEIRRGELRKKLEP
jgi:hypothetical protein